MNPDQFKSTPYLPSWDTRITYRFRGKDGQCYRIIVYMLKGERVRIMMGYTESIVDVVGSHANQRWEELTQEGYTLVEVETTKDAEFSYKAKKEWYDFPGVEKIGVVAGWDKYDRISDYALDA